MKNDQVKRLKALEGVLGRLEQRSQIIDSLDVKPHIAPVYYELDEDIRRGDHQNIFLPGGRGSGKSSFVALEIVQSLMKDRSGLSNAVVVRKYAVTLRGSCFSQIQWAIDQLGVSDRWISTLTPLQFVYKDTGQVIRLTGLDDASKLKSMKPTRGYFKYLWIEEFSEIVGEPELRSLQQSVLRGGDRFTCFFSFNPPVSSANWANRYIQRPDDRSVTLLTTYKDIPVEWLGEAFIAEAERLKEINPRAYENEYLGIATGNGSEVFPNLTIRKITDEEYNSFQYCYAGVDFGWAADPAVFIRVCYDRKTDSVFFMDEIYKRHCSNEELYNLIVNRRLHKWDNEPQYQSVFGGGSYPSQLRVICDCASPKDIYDLCHLGLKAVPCHKEAGAVIRRIKWLQHRRLIIDPARTPEAAREFSEYCYDVDRKSGEILSTVPDANNHTIDGVGYALNDLIFTGRVSA